MEVFPQERSRCGHRTYEEITISGRRPDPDYIHDTGLGLPLRKADQILDSFVTTKPPGGCRAEHGFELAGLQLHINEESILPNYCSPRAVTFLKRTRSDQDNGQKTFVHIRLVPPRRSVARLMASISQSL